MFDIFNILILKKTTALNGYYNRVLSNELMSSNILNSCFFTVTYKVKLDNEQINQEIFCLKVRFQMIGIILLYGKEVNLKKRLR